MNKRVEKYWCLLTNEVHREPPRAAPLPAGTGREEALAPHEDQTEPLSADCEENRRRITCSLLLRALKQVQVALRAVEEREEAAVVRWKRAVW